MLVIAHKNKNCLHLSTLKTTQTMSFLDLFITGKQKKVRTYFAALIKIAFSDGAMDKNELEFLEKMAVKLDISDSEFVEILENPENYPMDPPVDYDDRIEQLYNFIHMVVSDEEIKLDEVKTVRKLAIALGFPIDNVGKVTDEGIHLVMNSNNLEEFTKAIKEVNKY